MKYGIHIGLNKVDPSKYGGWNGILQGCINDATYMGNVINADGLSFLIDENATISKLISRFKTISAVSTKDDSIYITYSGHGGQEKDLNRDEADGMDETWCMYDGQILDDDIYRLINTLKGKVYVFSDSCHSGTITRAIYGLNENMKRPKQLPKEVKSEKALKIPNDLPNFKPNVLTLSACQDNQVSYDGDKNGAFTEAIMHSIKVNKDIDYVELTRLTRSQLKHMQTPKLTYRNGKSIIKDKIFS